jgi:hypothetical protein
MMKSFIAFIPRQIWSKDIASKKEKVGGGGKQNTKRDEKSRGTLYV